MHVPVKYASIRLMKNAMKEILLRKDDRKIVSATESTIRWKQEGNTLEQITRTILDLWDARVVRMHTLRALSGDA